jgi:Ca2+-binding EF-hand superfamily protein
MGNCNSYSDVYDKNRQLEAWRPQFEALQLKRKEIGKLYRIFRTADVDNSGTIGLPELLGLMDVERTPFSERVFSIFDEDGSGEIDFREFVLSLWNYCTLSAATLGLCLLIS